MPNLDIGDIITGQVIGTTIPIGQVVGITMSIGQIIGSTIIVGAIIFGTIIIVGSIISIDSTTIRRDITDTDKGAQSLYLNL
jgi:hypothetical protein